MADEKSKDTGAHSSSQYIDPTNLANLAQALRLPDIANALARLSAHVECLVEGAPEPEERKAPPAEFELRVWQNTSTGKLHMTSAGFDNGWSVEVAYDDSDKAVPSKVWSTELQFDLPESWVKEHETGSRFVTVYIRKTRAPGVTRPKEGQEEAETIIRTVPAPVGKNEARDFINDSPLTED